MATDPLVIISVIIALGAVSKLISEWVGVPNVVFLLAFGIAIGPEGIGFFSAGLTSEQLSLFVDIAVAIIIFEGAFSLTRTKIRATPRPTLYLVTIGSAITFVGLGLAIRGLLGLQWSISFLVSALLIATGPTVITPVLEQISVSEKVSSILETEGIVNDPVAAVVGAVVFSVTIGSIRVSGEGDIVADFISQVAIGILFGLVTVLLLAFVLRSFSNSVRDSRIVVLAAALLTYAVASLFATEAGVVAVAVAGLAMGNTDIPFSEEIAGFSDAISTTVLSAVYIVLAALIQFEDIVALGVGGLGVVVLAMVVVRPLAVFVSTYNSEFSLNQRAFIAAIGPRGIIPAATATLFSLQLSSAGIANASSVVSLVFLVILVTVVIEAGAAPLIAQTLNIVPMTTLIIGGSEIGRLLADRLDERGENPVIVERDDRTISSLQAAGYSVVHGDGTNADVLKDAGAQDAEMVIAATSDDAVNVLACQIARSTFGVETLISLVNDQTKVGAFRDIGVSTLTPTTATVNGIEELVALPSLFEWRATTKHRQKFAEETVISDAVDGKAIGALHVPDQAVLVLVKRGSAFIVPTQETVLRKGDRVTIFGRSNAVERARELLTG
ncbi:cation:proton antiporter [Haloferax sp. DFSO60]|uniref:cation:proton antiporter domain-containing protein n=1 Tax=Haloferax sp. DFSO60 TaxID=3388652 RepID=UPI00397AEBDD